MTFVTTDDLDALQSAIRANAWVEKTLRNNVDEAHHSLWEAARRLIDNAGRIQMARTDDDGRPLDEIDFHILGLPAPQGSKTRMPSGALVDGTSATGRHKLRSWRSAVAEATEKVVVDRESHGLSTPIVGAVVLKATFRLPMPRSRPKSLQRTGQALSSVRPDLDKLLRSLLDGLVQGGLIRDDAQIACVSRLSKIEVIGWTGAHVHLVRVGSGT